MQALWNTTLDLIRHYPELAIFLCLGAGYWVGGLKLGHFKLGTVVGTLVVALLVGQVGVEIPTLVRTAFFVLFMFATGYKVGPQFFAGLRRAGPAACVLPVIFAVVGLAATLLMAKLLGLDEGYAAGLLSGALTQSSAIGTAADAVARLPIDEAHKATLVNHIPIADAVTYVFGTAGAAVFLSKIAPWFIRADIKKESEELEKSLGGGDETPESRVFDAYSAIDVMAFRVTRPDFVDKTIAVLEQALGERSYVQRLRRGRRLMTPVKSVSIRQHDIVVLSGKRETLLKAQEILGEQVVDREAMDVPLESISVILTNTDAAGRTLRSLAETAPEGARGIQLRKIVRQGEVLPLFPHTRVERGDVLELVGRRDDLNRVIPHIGVPDRPTEATNIVFMGIVIVIGIAVGSIAINVGGVPIGLSSSGGVLVAGLLAGWLSTVRPQIGRIPPASIWLLETLGLNTFVAIVGLAAGPHALEAMREQGVSLLLAGIAVTMLPHLITLMVGRYLFGMNAGMLLGACAGCGTATAALQAVVDEADSSVPILGFTVPYAIGNVLLTACGPIVVAISHLMQSAPK